MLKTAIDYLDELKDHSILVSFQGILSPEMLTNLYSLIESNPYPASVDVKTRKKIYYIAVECLQNAYRHGGSSDSAMETSFIIAMKNGICRMITGNYILKVEIPNLIKLLESLEQLDEAEMLKNYRSKLSETSLSEKGGAGLGLIDIKRKSQSMKYTITSVSDIYSYFLLDIIIN